MSYLIYVNFVITILYLIGAKYLTSIFRMHVIGLIEPLYSIGYLLKNVTFLYLIHV